MEITHKVNVGYLNQHERFINSCIKHEIKTYHEFDLNKINQKPFVANERPIIATKWYAGGSCSNKPKLPRNSKCLCGSGLKHKHCCGKFEG